MSKPGPAAHLHVTSSAVVKSAPGQLVAVVLSPAAATATLTIYDNTTGSGTILVALQGAANGSSSVWSPTIPYSAKTGIYAAISGSGATATVVYL